MGGLQKLAKPRQDELGAALRLSSAALGIQSKFAKQLNRLLRPRKPSTRDEKSVRICCAVASGNARRGRCRVATKQQLLRLRAEATSGRDFFRHRIMPKCWLKPNRRALATAMIVPSFVAATGLVLLVVGMRSDQSLWLSIAGSAMLRAGHSLRRGDLFRLAHSTTGLRRRRVACLPALPHAAAHPHRPGGVLFSRARASPSGPPRSTSSEGGKRYCSHR